MKPSAGPNDVKVRLTEKFWRRFGAPINEKTAQLVVFTTHYADFGGERGMLSPLKLQKCCAVITQLL